MPLKIIRQDITGVKCDAIVNPTNRKMTATGGVDLQIDLSAGDGLKKFRKTVYPCKVGEIKISDGFNLKVKHIFHTVGPKYKGGGSAERGKLRRLYRDLFNTAKELGLESIAVPLISTGENRFPKSIAFKIATDAARDFLKENEITVYIVVYDDEAFEESKKLFDDVQSYIDENLIRKNHRLIKREKVNEVCARRVCFDSIERRRSAPEPCRIDELESMLKKLDESFAKMLFRLIDERGMSDVECYKRANVDKKTFSKIKCNPDYRPSKITALSFAIALRLDFEETQDLLSTVGMTLSRSSRFDVVIEYFIKNEIYDVFEINEVLFRLDQPLLCI